MEKRERVSVCVGRERECLRERAREREREGERVFWRERRRAAIRESARCVRERRGVSVVCGERAVFARARARAGRACLRARRSRVRARESEKRVRARASVLCEEREREEGQGWAFLSSSDLSHEIFSIKSVPLCMGIKPSLSAENL